MEIKKREVIVSVAIIAVMFVLGFLISGKIVDSQNDKNAEYNKAIHVNNTELFQYGMDTSAGNAFVYGELKAVDTVSLDEITLNVVGEVSINTYKGISTAQFMIRESMIV